MWSWGVIVFQLLFAVCVFLSSICPRSTGTLCYCWVFFFPLLLLPSFVGKPIWSTGRRLCPFPAAVAASWMEGLYCTLLLLVDSCILLLLLLLLLTAWLKLEITDLLQDLNPNLLWMLSCYSLLLLLLLQLKTHLCVLDDPWAVPELNSPGSCEVSFYDLWSSWVPRAWSFWRAADILERKE